PSSSRCRPGRTRPTRPRNSGSGAPRSPTGCGPRWSGPRRRTGRVSAGMREFVRLEVDDGVAVVRLDRPPANAIDLQVGRELGSAFGEASDRDDVGAVVVWGGPKLFAAGAD